MLHQKQHDMLNHSLQTFLTSLITSASVFAIEICLLSSSRIESNNSSKFQSYLQAQRYWFDESVSLKLIWCLKNNELNSSSGTTRWVLHLIRTLNMIILQNFGLDAFFFLQYIYILFTIFISLSVIVVLSLIPLNSLTVVTLWVRTKLLIGWAEWISDSIKQDSTGRI
jgi:hypothetical protein